MTKPKLILDFDGTLTDVDKNFHIYEARFAEVFSEDRGISRQEISALLEDAKNKIKSDPLRGWEKNGVIVAPAIVDPFVFNAVAYQDICQNMGVEPEVRDGLLQQCYREAYKILPTTFREGIESFFSEVEERYDPFVVTNSDPNHVARELESIGLKDVRVIGDAKKFLVDQNWNEVPVSMQPQGFPRAVMLRKAHYARALANIGAQPQDTTVMGDIYELDLALPDYLRMKTVLMVKDCTPDYEIAHVSKNPRGQIVRNLQEAKRVLLK